MSKLSFGWGCVSFDLNRQDGTMEMNCEGYFRFIDGIDENDVIAALYFLSFPGRRLDQNVCTVLDVF